MKQYNFLILLFICFMGLLSAQQINSEYFYYYKNGKINLDIDYNYFTVVTDGEYTASIQQNQIPLNVENSEKKHIRYNILQRDGKKRKMKIKRFIFQI